MTISTLTTKDIQLIYESAVHDEATKSDESGFVLDCVLDDAGGTGAVIRKLIDMVRARDAELLAVREAQSVVSGENCWSCGKFFTYGQRSECDGYCPHCDSPVDLDDDDENPEEWSETISIAISAIEDLLETADEHAGCWADVPAKLRALTAPPVPALPDNVRGRPATPDDSPYPATISGGCWLAQAWADGYNVRNAVTAAPESLDDTRRMDWLVAHHVEVRKPLLYGSEKFFTAQTLTDEEDDYHATSLREQIDAAMAAAPTLTK